MRVAAAPFRRSCQAAQRRRAFTLVEIIVSVAMLTLLTAGLASAIVISSHALPSRQTDGRAMIAANAALERLSTDLTVASGLVAYNERSIEFTVGDRDADGSSEQLRYSWSGDEGAPLTYTRNGSKEQTLLANVAEFSLRYDTRDVSEPKTTTATVSSGETLLASFTGWSGLTPTSTAYSISSSRFITQVFPVSWPSGASDCQITRIRCRMRTAGSTSNFTAGVYLPTSASNLAPGTQLGSSVTTAGNTLPASFGWQDFRFTDAGASASATQFVFLLKGGASSNVATVEYYNNVLARDDGTYCYWSTNSGSSWQPNILLVNANDMPIYIYGSYTTRTSQSTTLTRTLVYSATLTLRAVEQREAMVFRVDLLNTPEAVK